jgi:tRNA threonylcarbamoyladenosine biosynthesis protein TsaB
VNLLAFETSTRRLSVALWHDGEIRERDIDLPNGGSEVLLPWVHELLAEGEIAPSQLDGIAYGAGPGGFTGLRLACGVAQGLAFGLERPVVGVGSLEVLARAAFESTGAKKVFTCFDARMNEVYSAAWLLRDAVPMQVLPPAVSAPGDVHVPNGTDWLGCGDGFDSYSDALGGVLGGTLGRIRSGIFPTAGALVALAARRFARNEGVDAAQAAPLYVRDKVALTTAERLARGGLR